MQSAMPSSMETGPAAVVMPAASTAGATPAAESQSVTPEAAAAALAVRENGAPMQEPGESEAEVRLNRLPMQLDVMVKVDSFRVRDLLAMERGTVVETVHEHTQDVPLRSGGALLLWSEFEVLDQRLAVRVTRLA